MVNVSSLLRWPYRESGGGGRGIVNLDISQTSEPSRIMQSRYRLMALRFLGVIGVIYVVIGLPRA